ncbi:hypothetical protein JK211_16155 [Tatumella sp. JGM130]|uniref:hypothetical protein n=1 Tax=Tatumella sp. JGM130 TaxID=2799797 RepID=UPI001BB0C069|nr:hypothetical protein [Tatumella sp. JGM130]MBS0895533.1 hypothetical protein [Tatumella sp. JGM130]
MKNTKKIQGKGPEFHPERPVSLVDVAAHNRAFAARLIGEYRLAKAGVKNGRR